MTGYVPLNERPHGGHSRLLELALATRPTDVLDAGCSSGYLARPLSEAGARVVGLELDPDATFPDGRRLRDVLAAALE